VLIGEPPRSQGDLNFVLFGIPVRVHPFFWLATLLLGPTNQGAAPAVIWIIAVFISILVHEFGHAGMMRAYGFYPWITLHGMGGLTSYDQGRTYGSKGAGPLGQVLITLAGPMAGFLLAGLLFGIIFLSGAFESLAFVNRFLGTHERLSSLVIDILYICVAWGVINLLPIYPLDGGQITREIMLVFSPREGIRYSLILSMFAAGMVAIFAASRLQQWYIAAMFAYFAYSSYMMLQAYAYRQK
jgi:stage IV sporulation protein FB